MIPSAYANGTDLVAKKPPREHGATKNKATRSRRWLLTYLHKGLRLLIRSDEAPPSLVQNALSAASPLMPFD
jgi:hypothetical protein